MASFKKHIEPLITKEGGYKLINVKGDRGGRTYAGVSERANPKWEGWKIIEEEGLESPRLRYAVHALYRKNYWTPIMGDSISSSAVAEILFSSSVLSGTRTAVRLAQKACGAFADGVMGKSSISILNRVPEKEFLASFGLVRIARFSSIVAKDRSQAKFLRGWINRVLRELGLKV